MDVTKGIRPGFRLLADSLNVTDVFNSRLISITLTDESGMDSDVLEITLSDNDPAEPIEIPPKGAELQFAIGYDGALVEMGMFICDEIELSGWPGEMVIRARAAVYDKSKGGKTNLQTQKNRNWPKGTKLADMLAKVAKEHGMEFAIAKTLAPVVLPNIDQADESDINLLVRVAKKYDAIVKPANGKIVLAKRGESKTVGGEQLPTIVLTPGDCGSWRYVESARETAGMVVSYWHAVKQAKRNEVKVGSGEPVHRIKTYYPTEAMALAAARSELQRRQRGAITISLNAVGAPEYAAECPLTLEGFRPGPAGEWLTKRVVHTLDASSGYSCQIEGEKPNSEAEPEVTVTAHGTTEPKTDDSWLNDL